MDINKTIIQIDQAGGRTLEDVLNSNVAANVYGFVDSSDNKWKPVYGPLDTPAVKPCPDEVELLTYDAYIDRLHCEPPGMQELPKHERDVVWKEVSGKRRQAARNFTHRGEIGEAFAPLVELQRAHLKHGDEYYHIIPSFFHLINALSDLEMAFTLVFRTFGSDLDGVLKEWESFVMGTHFCQPSGAVLKKLKENWVEPLCGSVFRHQDDMYICYGPRVSLSSVPEAELDGTDSDGVINRLRRVPGCTSAYKTSFADLKDHLVEYFARSNGIGGLVDYYPNWAQGAERRSGGKVFPISLHDPDCYSVFFDDNIFIGDERSIVDLRDTERAESIIDPEVERKYCVPANAFQAIVNEDYFINELCDCLRLQSGL